MSKICDIEPFRYSATPLPDPETGASSNQINEQMLEDYIARLIQAVCDDVTALEAADTALSARIPWSSITVGAVDVDLPSIASNRSEFIDATVANVPLGTHIISWTPLTTATTIDDLMIQFVVVADDTVRITMMNPTAGAIDPDSITFQFVIGVV